MPKAKKSEQPQVESDSRELAPDPIGVVDHDKDAHAYHQIQLKRFGAGACDVCGKPVDAQPEWTKTSSCTEKFHAEQAAQYGAGACTVCGHNVVN